MRHKVRGRQLSRDTEHRTALRRNMAQSLLEHGRIIADGSHDELLEQSALYREIVEKGMPDQVFLTRNSLEVAGR